MTQPIVGNVHFWFYKCETLSYTPAVDKGRPAALGEFGAAGGQLVSTSTMVKMRQKTMQLV